MKRRVPTGYIPLMMIAVACVIILTLPAWGRPPRPAALRHNRALRITNASETWIEEWLVTDTLLRFPGGGRAGFYRRVVRGGQAVPPKGREGILYLYPESRYRPARLVRNGVAITPENCRLAVGAAANRNPRGEWRLRLLVDRRQLGQEVLVSGRDGWQDFAFDLAGFVGRRVNMEIEAGATEQRAPYVYLDYVRLENPAARPVTRLREPAGAGGGAPWPEDEAKAAPPGFDDSYLWFLELLSQKEERRQQEMMDRYHYYCRPRRP